MELSQAQQWLAENKDTPLGKAFRWWVQGDFPYSLGDLEVIEVKVQDDNTEYFNIKCANGNTAQKRVKYF